MFALLLCCSSAWARSALTLTSATATVSFYTSWSFDSTDCLGSTCPSEAVYNLFLNATASGAPFCDWAASEVAQAGNAKTFTNVGQSGVSLNGDAFAASLFSSSCSTTLLAQAANLVLLNGAPPNSGVQVNVVELSTAAPVTDETFAGYLCYVAPSTCQQQSTIVVNVFVSSFCRSGCIASTSAAPTCFGSAGCAAQGQCVAHNRCACAAGYAGPRCATLAGCDTDGCFHGGVCDAPSGVCTCPPGFSGARCEIGTTTSAAPAPAPTTSATPAAHGGALPSGADSWLAPFSIFPRGVVSHFGTLSFGQVPLRSNAAQNARKPLAQPLAAQPQIFGHAWGVADYARQTFNYTLTVTVPLNGALTIGNAPSTALTAQFGCAPIGLVDDAPLAALAGAWTPVASWVAIDWPAYQLRGALRLDAAHLGWLATSGCYVELTQASGAAAARAQLSRVDEVHFGALAAGGAAQYQGAAAYFVDLLQSAAQYWIYYTTPLTYVERGASVHLASTSADDTLPLGAGTAALRRIGAFAMGNFSYADEETLVGVYSKTGLYNLAPPTLAALRGGQLMFDAVGVDAVAGAVDITGLIM